MKRAWIVVAIVLGLFLFTDWILHRDGGLNRTVTTRGGRDVVDSGRVRTVDLRDLAGVPGFPSGITLRWEGAWNVPSTGLYHLTVESHGPSAWRIDGELAHEVTTASQSGVSRIVWLAAGFHRIEITYDPDPASPHLVVSGVRAGQAPPGSAQAAPLSPRALKPRLPRNPHLHAAGILLRPAFAALLVVTLAMAIRRTMPLVFGVWGFWRNRFVEAPFTRSALGRSLAWALLAAILMYGALLRIDAITAAYGPVTSPAWLAAVQTRAVIPPDAIRPAHLVWQPAPLYPHADGRSTRYFSDPYLYVKAGREMRSFYGAHDREPVFPFATKVFLALLNGQDVAVSFAATAFSLLAIWATYILGAAVWSRPAGLAAALGLALDVDDIALASAGWRDDAFIATVAVTAYLMLRSWRAGTAPARTVRIGRMSVDAAYVDAFVLGVVSGLAILVRIMAVSFVFPGAALLLLGKRSSWRRRVTMVGIIAVTAVVVAAPYFVNCWRVYGDPLYTFNIHGNVYRIAEGQGASSQGTAAYVIGKFRSAPIGMTDTIARGLTTYPFNNKWQGLERWIAGIRDWAMVAAAAGLVLLAATVPGRWMLFVMIMSLVPFAFTWTVDPNWRFTAHVYPGLLIAAAAAISGAARGVRAVLVPRPRRAADVGAAATSRRGTWIAWGAAGIVVLAGAWSIASTFPRMLFDENLRRQGVATVTAGTRDLPFLGRGWSDVAGSGNVRMRVAVAHGVVSIPLPDPADYDVTLRMDPFPRPLRDSIDRLPVIEISLNGTPVSMVALQWNAERVGIYQVRLPRALTRRGANRLALRLQRPTANAGVQIAGLSDGAAFGLWYVRVQSVSPTGGAALAGR